MLFKLHKIGEKVSGVLAVISCVGVVAVALFTVISVILRYIFKNPIIGSTEYVECMMAVMVFSCLAYTQAKGGHITISMVLRILPRTLAMIINAIGYVAVTVFCGYCSYCLFLQGGYASEKGLISALVNIPYYPFYYFASVCMVVFTFVLFIDALIAIAAIVSTPYRDSITANWN